MRHSVGPGPEVISQQLDMGKQTDIIDISKAFGTVHHSALLKRLKTLNVHGNLYFWFSSYLLGRKQRYPFQELHPQPFL
jgi:hypothetical protein